MKTIEQLKRYISLCAFSDSDWRKLTDYCWSNYPELLMRKGRRPKCECTFEDFLKWESRVFGQGDFVKYGNICGVIGDCYGDIYTLAIYQDYDKNIITKTMVVMDPHRLMPLDELETEQFREILYQANTQYNVKFGVAEPSFHPQPLSYIKITKDPFAPDNVGLYLGSKGDEHRFAAFYNDENLLMNCNLRCSLIYLSEASDKDVRKFHTATSKADLSFNERTMQFCKTVKRGMDNVYWYMSERFEILRDKDNGSKKHEERFDAGNYFIDHRTALLFLKAVKGLREESI